MLKGGIGVGIFWKFGKVISMEFCIELCCKIVICDVVFFLVVKCYGVECVSDDECKVIVIDIFDIKVFIVYVWIGYKKG